MSLSFSDFRVAVPKFRYRAVDANGIVENEFCPVVVGRVTEGTPTPDPTEVSATAWLTWEQMRTAMHQAPERCSPWSVTQVDLLSAWDGLSTYVDLSTTVRCGQESAHG